MNGKTSAREKCLKLFYNLLTFEFHSLMSSLVAYLKKSNDYSFPVQFQCKFFLLYKPIQNKLLHYFTFFATEP